MEDNKKELSVEDIMLSGVREAKKEEVVVDKKEESPEVIEDLSEDLGLVDDVSTSEAKEDAVEVAKNASEDAAEEKEEVVEDKEDKYVPDWDDNPKEDEGLKDINVYQDLGTDLGFDSISTKEELVGKLREKAKLKEEESGKKFDKIPADLKRALDIAENGVDYSSIFNEVDYGSIDAKTFFVESAKEHFLDEAGNLDSQALEEFIEMQDPKMIDIQGSSIKKQYVEQQEAKKQALVLETRQRKELTEVKLKNALKDFNSFNEFKVNEAHKQQLYKDITTGKAMKEMFYDKNDEYDMSKVIKAYFYYLKGEQMETFRGQRARSGALRDVVKDANNADLKVNGRRVTSNAKVDRPSPFDLLAKSVGMIQD